VGGEVGKRKGGVVSKHLGTEEGVWEGGRERGEGGGEGGREGGGGAHP